MGHSYRSPMGLLYVYIGSTMGFEGCPTGLPWFLLLAHGSFMGLPWVFHG